MNLLNTALGAGIGYLTGGAAGAVAGGLQGLTGANGSTLVGNGMNAGAAVINAQSEANNLAIMAENERRNGNRHGLTRCSTRNPKKCAK